MVHFELDLVGFALEVAGIEEIAAIAALTAPALCGLKKSATADFVAVKLTTKTSITATNFIVQTTHHHLRN